MSDIDLNLKCKPPRKKRTKRPPPPIKKRLSKELSKAHGDRNEEARIRAAMLAAEIEARKKTDLYAWQQARLSENKPLELDLKWLKGYDPYRDSEDYEFDEMRAKAAITFFEARLIHVKGEMGGKAFLLQEWERTFIATLFGWKHKVTGLRRYREVLLYIPRKNGKTLLADGIGLYCLSEDEEPGAEIYAAAADRDQAKLLWDVAKFQVGQNPYLSNKCTVLMNSISVDSRAASFKAISADASTKHGYNGYVVIIDELHAQKNSALVDVLKTSMGSRRQPLLVYLTTADFARESVCNTVHDYACKVRDGRISDPSFLPVIYETAKDADWKDKKTWYAANPNLGITPTLEYFEREFKRACEDLAYQNTFRRLHLNQITEQENRFIEIEKWDACKVVFPRKAVTRDGAVADVDALEGCKCWAGLDLASVSDLCAFVLFFPEQENKVLPFFWLPSETAKKREARDRISYLAWASAGYIKLTTGNVTDYDVIRADINAMNERFNIQQIAIDRWNSTQLQTQLAGDGVEVIAFGQGFASMTAPTKELSRLILEKHIRHDGNPVLRWNMGNVSVETDAAGNLKPSKEKSSEKIDGVVALIMAIGISMLRPVKSGSVYKDRGIIKL